MRLLIAFGVLSGLQGVPVEALEDPPKCARVAFGNWDPPLDWSGSGNAGVSSSFAGRLRHLRDSVFAAGGGVGSKEEMQWLLLRGKRALVLFPEWWPTGVIIEFDASAPSHTLRGQARALSGAGNTPVSRTRATVLAVCS